MGILPSINTEILGLAKRAVTALEAIATHLGELTAEPEPEDVPITPVIRLPEDEIATARLQGRGHPCCCPSEAPTDTICAPCRRGRHRDCVG